MSAGRLAASRVVDQSAVFSATPERWAETVQNVGLQQLCQSLAGVGYLSVLLVHGLGATDSAVGKGVGVHGHERRCTSGVGAACAESELSLEFCCAHSPGRDGADFARSSQDHPDPLALQLDGRRVHHGLRDVLFEDAFSGTVRPAGARVASPVTSIECHRYRRGGHRP